jgi:hypothetical protein
VQFLVIASSLFRPDADTTATPIFDKGLRAAKAATSTAVKAVIVMTPFVFIVVSFPVLVAPLPSAAEECNGGNFHA